MANRKGKIAAAIIVVAWAIMVLTWAFQVGPYAA